MFDTRNGWWRASTLYHCSHWGSLETGCDLNETSYTFQFILYGPNRGLWHVPGLFWYIKHRLVDQTSLEIMHDTLSHVTCEVFLLRSTHEMYYIYIWRVGNLWKWNHKNAGFVTSLKFTCLETLYVYSICKCHKPYHYSLTVQYHVIHFMWVAINGIGGGHNAYIHYRQNIL